MPPNAVCSMPSAFGIGFIFNAVGIADAVTSIEATFVQIPFEIFTVGEFCGKLCQGKIRYCAICNSASELEKSYKIGDLCPYKPPSGPGLCLATNPDTNPICILCRALQPHD